jgi:hypothetical protein
MGDDGERLAASIGERLDGLTFAGLTTDEVTDRIIVSITAWATEQGWRVYRRAPSVMTLPPPMERQHSVLDMACARPDGPPVVVEVDHTDRRRTVDKLVVEAQAGRVAIWVRWGTGRFAEPEPSVHMVTCEVTRHNGPAGRVYSRTPGADRPPPEHSAGPGTADTVALPIPFTDTGTP